MDETPKVDNPLVPVTVRRALQHLFHYAVVVGGFLHTFGTDPASAGCPSPVPPFTCCSPAQTPFRPTCVKTPESLRRAAPIGQPAPIPAPHWLLYCRSAPSAAPQVPARSDGSEKRRERPRFRVLSKRTTLAWEPAVAEEPWMRASGPAPPHELRLSREHREGSRAPHRRGPRVHTAPRSGRALGRPGRRRSHHRGEPRHGSHLVVLGPGLQVLQRKERRVVQAERVWGQRRPQRPR